jgi:hypothetical protein
MMISQVQLRGCIYFYPSLGTDQQVENKATDYSFFDEHLPDLSNISTGGPRTGENSRNTWRLSQCNAVDIVADTATIFSGVYLVIVGDLPL